MTNDQRNQLVSTYLESGPEVARAMAVLMGVSPRYVAKLLRKRGIKNTTKRGCKPGTEGGKNDPRWQWAIQRGPVLV